MTRTARQFGAAESGSRSNAITDFFARRLMARRPGLDLIALLMLAMTLFACGAGAQSALTPLSTTEVGPGVYVHSGGGEWQAEKSAL